MTKACHEVALAYFSYCNGVLQKTEFQNIAKSREASFWDTSPLSANTFPKTLLSKSGTGLRSSVLPGVIVTFNN